MSFIDNIVSKSDKKINKNNKEYYFIDDYVVYIWRDDDKYLNGLQYKKINEISWIYSTPEEFYLEIVSKKLNYIEYQVTDKNVKKLSKPKELKGVKAMFSGYYINKKCKYQVFINGNDLWVKHGDYFSESLNVDRGTPLSYRLKKFYMQSMYCKDKFIYADTWGDIVIRRQAWIKIENLMLKKYLDNRFFTMNELVRLQEKALSLDEYELENSDMARMWEDILNKISDMNISK